MPLLTDEELNSTLRNAIASRIAIPVPQDALPYLSPPNVNMQPQGLFPEVGKTIGNYIHPNTLSHIAGTLVQPQDEYGNPNVGLAGPIMVGKAAEANAFKIFKDIKSMNPSSLAEAGTYFTQSKYPSLSKLPNWVIRSA